MDSDILLLQYQKTYSFFKTTTEPFDFLEWDGNVLKVWYQDLVIEKYTHSDLKELIEGL